MNKGPSLQTAIISGLRWMALLLRLCRIFLPGIIVVAGTGILMAGFIQGRDVIQITLESEWRGFFFMTSLVFWSTVTWYSSRLIAYNQDDLFNEWPAGLFHAPRILGFACITVVGFALLALPSLQWGPTGQWIWIAMQILTYSVAARQFEHIQDKFAEKKLIAFRNMAILCTMVFFSIAAIRNEQVTYILTLPFVQVSLLFLVVTRRKIREAELMRGDATPEMSGRSYRWLRYILSNPQDQRTNTYNERILRDEIAIFRIFNIVAFVSISIWLMAIFHLPTARVISTLPIVMLALGVLLGVGNLISLYSVKTRINLHVLFIGATFLIGSMFEPHNVRRTWPPEPSAGNNYANRPDLQGWFKNWIASRKTEITDTAVKEYPVFLLLADGGASRSAYWAAGVWSKLEAQTNGRFSRHLLCLSGTSGGSLGNVAFFASLAQKNVDTGYRVIQKQCREYLSQDFLSHTMARLLGPDLLKPLFPLDVIYDRAAALEQAMEHVPVDNPIAERMSEPLSGLCPAGSGALPILFINTTRMQDGRPAVISSIKVNDTVFGKRLDVLATLPSQEDIRVSTAVVLGARFPYISPAGRLEDNYFVDGGYFDNSGAGVVHETLIELKRIIDDSVRITKDHWLSKIRFHVLHATNAPLEEPGVDKVHPVVNDLFAPVKTLLGAYASQTYVNNLRLTRFLKTMPGGAAGYTRFNLYRPGEQDNFPMNWAISRENLKRMDERMESDSTLKDLIQYMNTILGSLQISH